MPVKTIAEKRNPNAAFEYAGAREPDHLLAAKGPRWML
jgi:hypothetical protein